VRPASRYVFRSEWRLAAPPDRVFLVLADVEAYPRWWPEVRRARRIDGASGELTCRSLLPYDLVFAMHREVEDRQAGVLRARLAGDLLGTTQWTVAPDGDGTRAVFDEDVAVGKGTVRAAGRLLKPVVRLNHELMMRSGERGLRRWLTDPAAEGA
jgi:uncharacterized protein YndB with AHSA1/START domain